MDIRKTLNGYKLMGIPLILQGILYYFNSTDNVCCKCIDKSIEAANILDGTEIIEVRGFERCDNLAQVNLPKSVHIIAERAFRGCGKLQKVTCDGILKHISIMAFEDDVKLQTINLNGDNLVIDPYAFTGCNALTKVSITGTLSLIRTNAFYDSGLRDIELAEGLKVISSQAFGDTQLLELALPTTVETLESYCFDFCTLKTLFLSSQLKHIAFEAFHGTLRLKTIHVPKGMPISTLPQLLRALPCGTKIELVVHSRLLYLLLRVRHLDNVTVVADYT